MAPPNRRKLLKAMGTAAASTGFAATVSADEDEKPDITRGEVQQIIAKHAAGLIKYLHSEGRIPDEDPSAFVIPEIAGRSSYHRSEEATTVAYADTDSGEREIVLIRKIVRGSKFVFNIDTTNGTAHAIEYPDYEKGDTSESVIHLDEDEHKKKSKNSLSDMSLEGDSANSLFGQRGISPLSTTDSGSTSTQGDFTTLVACTQSKVCRSEIDNCHKWTVNCCLSEDYCVWGESVGPCYGGFCYGSCCQPCDVSTC